jgi:hypothetical protein
MLEFPKIFIINPQKSEPVCLRVYSSVGGGDNFLGQALSVRGAGSHSGFSDTHAHEEQGLGESSHGGDVDGLSLDTSSAAEPGAVFSGASFAGGFNEDFNGVSSGHEVDDIENNLDNPDGLGLFAWVSALELDTVHKSLNNGASQLAERLELVSSSSMGYENLRSGGAHSNLVNKNLIGNFDFVVPFAEELGLLVEFDSSFVSDYSLQKLSNPEILEFTFSHFFFFPMNLFF